MIIFSRYMLLWLLLGVPLIPMLYGLMRYLRRRRLRALGDEELVRQMKGSGIGTPATRAAIIERLLKVGYAFPSVTTSATSSPSAVLTTSR